MIAKELEIKQITSVLVVDAIEPALPLWEQQLGFKRIVEVPHAPDAPNAPDEGRLGFVILARDGAQVMMQTKASLAVDLPKIASLTPTSVTYIDVASLAPVRAALESKSETGSEATEVLVPERTTPYGAREIWVRDGSGQILGFAEHPS